MQTMKTYTIGAHEAQGKTPGDAITGTRYTEASVGSGMDRAGSFEGVLIRVVNPCVRRHGCSFAWAIVEVEPNASAEPRRP